MTAINCNSSRPVVGLPSQRPQPCRGVYARAVASIARLHSVLERSLTLGVMLHKRLGVCNFFF